MKKVGLALLIILLTVAVLGGVVYTKNNGAAQASADRALTEFRSRPSLDTWKRPEELTLLLERVRTIDADAAPHIANALEPYQSSEARDRIAADSIDPDDVPELALLESAGASRSCNLTGGIVPIADNPFETEILLNNDVLTLGNLMAAKANERVARGLQNEAEHELLLLLSVGAHLEEDVDWASLALGLAMQQTALDALTELYAARGENAADSAAAIASVASSVETKREFISKFPPFLEMSLSDRGIEELAAIAQNDSLPRALRLESIMALNAGYLFHINRVVLGPESKRVEIVDGLKIDDPVLADVASKARTALLEMPFSERRQSVTMMSVIE